MSEENKKPQVILHDKNGRVLTPWDDGLFAGYVYDKDFVTKQIEPDISWKGPKIPYDLWRQIVWFMKWGQKTTKHENHLALFFHKETGQWAAWAFPQSGVGMTVKTLPDHPLYAEDRKQFGKGWIMAGSVHHHCEGSAFQSGVDRADEAAKEGIHFTIGKTPSEEIDVHVRLVWSEAMATGHITKFIEAPDWLVHVPKKLKGDALKVALLSPDEIAFPEAWKSRIIVEEKKIQTWAPSKTLITGSDTRGTRETAKEYSFQEAKAFLVHLAGTEGITLGKMNHLLNLDALQVAHLADDDSNTFTRINNAIALSKFNFGLALAVLEDLAKNEETRQLSLL